MSVTELQQSLVGDFFLQQSTNNTIVFLCMISFCNTDVSGR